MEEYLQQKGRIFDIQKFSIHDGPGIRTVVFLKGCVLRCKWCCNPESQEYKCQKMLRGGKERLMGEDVTVAEVMDRVLGDSVYYRNSGGGITLSGGECMCQPQFALALLKATHDAGFNTAIETTACAPLETVKMLLPHVDNFLMDIKHIDSAKHKAFTTRDNALILENARYIAKNAKRYVVRVPVIPTFNDTAEEIGMISRFASDINPGGEINLLPYHRLGMDKYEGLGREYLLPDILPPTDEHMEELLNVAKGYGLKAQIGG